jgi:FkbM family methyltransferase
MGVPLREYLRLGKWQDAVGRRWFRERLRRGIPVTLDRNIVKVGSDYGGWMIPSAAVQSDWIVYAIGAGTDVSFETGLIDTAGCEVHTFDPTPEAVDHASRLGVPRLHFHPYALWTSDESVIMHLPRAGSGSLSAVNLQRTNETITLPGRSLPSLMAELGHDHIDLLKVDIEGAEYDILTPTMVADAGVRILAIDLHANVPARRAIAFLRGFLSAGYQAVAREETDFTLVRAF